MALTKWSVTLVAVVALLGIASVQADAESDLGDFCWTLTAFNDTFRCSIQQGGGSASDMFHLFCRVRSAGAYQLVGAGLASNSFPTAGSVQLAFEGANPTPSFGGNDHCMFQASLNPSTLGGPLTINCTGTATPFNTSATMVFGACSGTMDAGTNGPPVGQ
jgi:hypothetical protein